MGSRSGVNLHHPQRAKAGDTSGPKYFLNRIHRPPLETLRVDFIIATKSKSGCNIL